MSSMMRRVPGMCMMLAVPVRHRVATCDEIDRTSGQHTEGDVKPERIIQ